jgi:hypothetical protein
MSRCGHHHFRGELLLAFHYPKWLLPVLVLRVLLLLLLCMLLHLLLSTQNVAQLLH